MPSSSHSKSEPSCGPGKQQLKAETSGNSKLVKRSVPSDRMYLARNAWYDHIEGNPLKIPKVVYKQLEALAPEREKYQYAAHKCVSKHYGTNFAVTEDWIGRIEQKLGATKMPILPPPKATGWKYVQSFKDYLDEHYPAPVIPDGDNDAHERNLAVVKVYRTGMDSMGEHNDAQSHTDVPIASLSVGATRSIIVREAKGKMDAATGKRKQRKKWTIELAHGDVFIMDGDDFQTQFTHELPQEKEVKDGRAAVVLRARKDKMEVKASSTKKRPSNVGSTATKVKKRKM